MDDEPKRTPGWKRYTLHVNRKDRPIHRTAPPPRDEPKGDSRALKLVGVILGVIVLVALVGCGLFWGLLAIFGVR